MHGTGNDFVLLDSIFHKTPRITRELARRLCDRRYGVGCDQLLVLAPSKKADFRMDIFNADGGEVEMCGNGIRALAKYVRDHKLSTKGEIEVETIGGIIRPKIVGDLVEVDMGEPVLEGENIPVSKKGRVINSPLLQFNITCVSMGNPHCVIFVEGVDKYPVTDYGPVIENHPFFPKRVNVEFVEVIDLKRLKIRVWERGAGETHACGTGACATVVASVLNKKTGRDVVVGLKGGELEIRWDEKSNHVFMTGPAETVFEGEIEI